MEEWEILGHTVKVETAAEIIAKKMHYRGDKATARDLFDLALVIEREPDALRGAAEFLIPHRAAFLAQIHQPHPVLRAAFDAIATLEYTPGFDECVALAGEFFESL